MPPSSPVKDGAHPGTVRAVPVYVQAGGKQDPVSHGYGAVREGGDQQLIPAWGEGQGSTRSLCCFYDAISVPSPHPQPDLREEHVLDSSLSTLKSGFLKWDPGKCT